MITRKVMILAARESFFFDVSLKKWKKNPAHKQEEPGGGHKNWTAGKRRQGQVIVGLNKYEIRCFRQLRCHLTARFLRLLSPESSDGQPREQRESVSSS
jgi:hypothetical protein